jgi:hypothetical protein
MIARLARFAAPALTLLCLSTGAASAQTASSTPMRVDTKSVIPILETNHARYPAGEPVLLRTSVKNTTPNRFSMMFGSVYSGIVHLTVRNASGNMIEPKNTPLFFLKQGSSMPLHTPLAPRQTMVLAWGYVDGDKWVEQPWVDLSDWGYSPLEPGTYKLTVDLETGGWTEPYGASTGEHFGTYDASGNGPASSVTITVEPAPTTSPLPVVKDAVIPTLETNHSRYAVGDAILLKTTLKNVTGTDYELLITHYWAAVHLTLEDSSGSILQPQTDPQFYTKNAGTSMPVYLPLNHGQTRVVAWEYAEAGRWVKQDWIDLSTFGYAQLPPGRYTLTVVVRAGLRIGGQSSVTVDPTGNGTPASATFTVDAPQ